MCACRGSPNSVSSPRTNSVFINVFLRVVILSLSLLLAHPPHPVSCVLVSEFFPFGANTSDRQTERTDDGGSGEIKLSIMFPFFGQSHNKIYVNNNGVVSFVAELQRYTPQNFPLTLPTPIIAPFWADVDISNRSGTVWFRETRDLSILAKATHEIRTYSAFRNFRAYWVFVATWDEVGFYGAFEAGLKKKNTFQSVLVLDATGQQSFVILNYAKIEWTTGSNSQGDITTGLGGSPAQAGFNAGDTIHYFEIKGARTPAVINLTQISNVGVPGKWIFRIDSAEIQDVCSQFDSGMVTFQPTYSSMLGGSSLTVNGLCFDLEIPPLKGQIVTAEGDTEEICCFVEDVAAKCYLPPLFQTGMVNISLNVDDHGWNYSGQVEIKNIVDVTIDVIRINPDNWMTGSRVSVTWNIEFYEEAESYKFEVLNFTTTNGRSALKTVYTVTHPRNNLRTYWIDLPKVFSGASIAVVRVTALPNNCSSDLVGPAIYSDVFPVRFADVSLSDATCTHWASQQLKFQPLAVTGHCPCTLRQAEGDTAQYSPDPFCTVNSDWPSNCKYRSTEASLCIIPNQISDESGTFVCCYDSDNGELLIALEGYGGSTMERYSIYEDSQSVVPYFTYMQEEITPYMHCCEYSQNTTLYDLYLKVRPPVDCRGYQPPAAAQAAGDPHLVTLDDLPYTFNGIGIYTLLRVKGTQATVQVRAVPAPNNQNQPQNATVFSAVAVKASNTSSVLEINLRMPGEDGLVSVYKDSTPYPLSTSISQLSEMVVYRNNTQNGTELTVVMEDLGLSVLVQATEDMLNIMVMAGSALKGKLEGLLGNYNGNKEDDLTARDGTVLDRNASMRDIHYIFGMSWYVSENDSLFMPVQDTDFDMSSNQSDTLINANSFNPVFLDEINETNLPNDTEVVCGRNPECWYDYMVTGIKAIALATKLFSERYEERRKDVSEVVRCPYVNSSAIENGSRNLTGLQVGASITVKCDDGFHISGTYEVTCEGNGEWNTSPPTCEQVVIPDESFPFGLAIGAASGGFVLLVVIVVVIKVVCKRYPRRKVTKSEGSEMEQATNLPVIFPISDIPSPVFENSLFLSSLQKLNETGGFHIPRPTFVDPNIYSDFF